MKKTSMNCCQRLRATYNFQPLDRMYRREFYIWPESIGRWLAEGMPVHGLTVKDVEVLAPGDFPPELSDIFHYDRRADFPVEMLGWCEPPFVPPMENKLIESTDKYDIVRDVAGRTVRYFKGKRHGFMPTYLKHAVESDRDWEENIAPLLSTDTAQRWEKMPEVIKKAEQAQAEGKMICQRIVGGYMFLRSLAGPEGLCYMFVDNPGLIHKMMARWLELADAVTSRIQEYVEYDEFFMAEDICYNHGLLISPDMVREFLLPYYQQAVDNIKKRQKNKKLFVQVDTDGLVTQAIDLYRQIGMNVMSPFEVRPGNDVLEISRKYPDLVMIGGIDKTVLAEGPEAIDDYLEKLIPPMVQRGGFVPTCDHGVPDNVSYANYMHYRKRMIELDH